MKRLGVLLLLLTVACSGSSGSKTSSSDNATPAGIASAIGCSGYQDESTEEVYVQRYGTCTIGSDEVRVYTFKDAATRDNWLKVARGFGGTFAVKDRAVVTSDSAAAVDAAASKLGVSAS